MPNNSVLDGAHGVVHNQAAKPTTSRGVATEKDVAGCGGEVGCPSLPSARGGTTTQLEAGV